MSVVTLSEVGTAQQVVLDADRSRLVLDEIKRVRGPIWARLLWWLLHRRRGHQTVHALGLAAPDIVIEIGPRGPTYHVYARAVLADRRGRAVQFYMGLLLEEWLQP